MELRPYGSLETLIALPGRHDRLEVELLPAGSGRDGENRPRKHSSRRKKSAAPR
jgi:hypothetical protein